VCKDSESSTQTLLEDLPCTGHYAISVVVVSACLVGRVEVSPKAREKGVGGRVVKIEADRSSCGPSLTRVLKLVMGAVITQN
jgi:hypothetical protein